jgi:hypothetical protein
MKLLCTESNLDICNDIVNRLASEGIESELRQRNPSLFDSKETPSGDLREVWIVNDADTDKANNLLYPDNDES